MPFKEWTIELGKFRVYVWRQSYESKFMSFAVVLLAWNGLDLERATRYDCAHGFIHRDGLEQKAGLLYKQTFPA